MDIMDLFCIEEIKKLKARYFRYIDTKEWENLRGLFVDDALLSFAEIDPAPYTRDAGIEMIRNALEGCTSIHHGHMPEITLQSPDAASGIWAMEDILHWNEDAQGVLGRSFTRGFGHYHETYRRINGRWMIQSLRLSRLRVESTLSPFRIS